MRAPLRGWSASASAPPIWRSATRRTAAAPDPKAGRHPGRTASLKASGGSRALPCASLLRDQHELGKRSTAAGREGVVKKDAIWVDTVKRGDVPIVVRALGNLTAPTTVELQVADVQAKELRDGQAASIEFRSGKMTKGSVSKVDTHATNGTVRVTIVLQEPAAKPANEPADGMIQVRTLNNVVYVRRPPAHPPSRAASSSWTPMASRDTREGAVRRAVRTEPASSRRPAAGRSRHPQRYGQVRRLRSCEARVIRRSEKLSPEENGRRSFVGGAAVFAKAAFLRDPDGGGILGSIRQTMRLDSRWFRPRRAPPAWPP